MMNLTIDYIMTYALIGAISWIEWVAASTFYLSIVLDAKVPFSKMFKLTIMDDLRFDNKHWLKWAIRWTWFILWPVGLIRNGVRMISTANRLLNEKRLSEL